jgi:hypothetical protein
MPDFIISTLLVMQHGGFALPNQVWSWDITKLLGPAKWTYYYLYVILDIFSRYVVDWMAAERESATLAERLITATCEKQEIPAGQLTIHADRGTAMTAKCSSAKGGHMKTVPILLTPLLLGIATMDAAAEEVVILVCREGFGGPVRPVEVDACSKSAGVHLACPTRLDPDPTTPGPSCAEALADFRSLGFRIRHVPARDFWLVSRICG